MSKTLAFALGAAALAVTALPASAQVRWSTPASSCTIVEGSSLAVAKDAEITFKIGAIGTIRLMCPISDMRGGLVSDPTPSIAGSLFIRYHSSTGQDPTARVEGTLVKTPFLTGVPAVKASAKSTVNPPTSNGTSSGSIQDTETEGRLDFEKSAYHVEVMIARDKATHSVGLTSVSVLRRLHIPL